EYQYEYFFDKYGEDLVLSRNLREIRNQRADNLAYVYLYKEFYDNVYLNSEIYEFQKSRDRNYTLPGNVTYYYNYDGSPNDGYYWLDNYNYGEKIQYPPENPAREGFMFYGWYKEAECINKWEFETDALPDSLPDGNGGEVYQETNLFAKWIKGV
ncbi:MAG: InlB B-repeat-containing protein, partial [Clostridia bacterium]|nr:InlB B-repeat-containing protein [Clostridia bacterium]